MTGSALTQDFPNRLEQHKQGQVILFPGESQYLYRVLDGLVRIHSVDDDGAGLTLRYVKPGGFFGEEALSEDARHYFAEAVTDCEIEVLEPGYLSGHDYAALTEHLIEAVGRLYRSLYRLSGKRLRARIAAELLELRDSALASPNERGEVVVQITHDELAAAVGSVRETVTKVVGELGRLGAIDSGYGKIVLKDLTLLEQTADT
jgi:CRP/FNR family transcriptional regulator, cyclic AMP receptor protein